MHGYQDGVVPGDRVWIDETLSSDTDLAHGYGQARKRGLSGTEVLHRRHDRRARESRSRSSADTVSLPPRGSGPRSAATSQGTERWSTTGSAHNGVLRDAAAEPETYKADVRDPVCPERMTMVNNLCSCLKRYLWRFTGMSAANR